MMGMGLVFWEGHCSWQEYYGPGGPPGYMAHDGHCEMKSWPIIKIPLLALPTFSSVLLGEKPQGLACIQQAPEG